ncbi:MAG: hypothetical protein WBD09_09505 [Halobacteriota archaeon]
MEERIAQVKGGVTIIETLQDSIVESLRRLNWNIQIKPPGWMIAEYHNHREDTVEELVRQVE